MDKSTKIMLVIAILGIIALILFGDSDKQIKDLRSVHEIQPYERKIMLQDLQLENSLSTPIK